MYFISCNLVRLGLYSELDMMKSYLHPSENHKSYNKKENSRERVLDPLRNYLFQVILTLFPCKTGRILVLPMPLAKCLLFLTAGGRELQVYLFIFLFLFLFLSRLHPQQPDVGLEPTMLRLRPELRSEESDAQLNEPSRHPKSCM